MTTNWNVTSSSLDLIRTFLAVADCRSFSAAARRLDISPTAVSKAVRTIERQHGVILFQRTTRSVSPTDAGKALYERLKDAVTRIDGAFEALGAYRARSARSSRAGSCRPCAGRIRWWNSSCRSTTAWSTS